MINDLSKISYLENNVKISSNHIFNGKNAFENTMEDVGLENLSKQETNKENKIEFYSLGAPAGFFLDNYFTE